MGLNPRERWAEAHRLTSGLAYFVALPGLRRSRGPFKTIYKQPGSTSSAKTLPWGPSPDREPPAPTVQPLISLSPHSLTLGEFTLVSITSHLQRCGNPSHHLGRGRGGVFFLSKVKKSIQVDSNPSQPKAQQFRTCAGPGLFFLLA